MHRTGRRGSSRSPLPPHRNPCGRITAKAHPLPRSGLFIYINFYIYKFSSCAPLPVRPGNAPKDYSRRRRRRHTVQFFRFCGIRSRKAAYSIFYLKCTKTSAQHHPSFSAVEAEPVVKQQSLPVRTRLPFRPFPVPSRPSARAAFAAASSRRRRHAHTSFLARCRTVCGPWKGLSSDTTHACPSTDCYVASYGVQSPDTSRHPSGQHQDLRPGPTKTNTKFLVEAARYGAS